MSKIAIVTDSNAGISQQEAKSLGNVYVIPMPFSIDGNEFYEDINLSQEEFYQKLTQDAEISTSQPAIGYITDLWEKLLKEYDYVIHIPMSSALSMSCETAKNFAGEYNGKVLVVDNKRISVTLKQSVYDAQTLIRHGKSAEEIKEILEKTALDSSIYIMVDTLKYLKRGGRITPAAAAIGTILRIKPVLQTQGGKLDQFAKARNEKDAIKRMIEAVKKDLANRFKELRDKGEMELFVAYTSCRDKAELFAKQIQTEIPDLKLTHIDPLSLSVSCHIGSGSLAIACCRTIK